MSFTPTIIRKEVMQVKIAVIVLCKMEENPRTIPQMISVHASSQVINPTLHKNCDSRGLLGMAVGSSKIPIFCFFKKRCWQRG